MLLSTSSSSPSCNSRPGTYTYRNVNTRKSSYVVQLHAPALDAHLRLRRLRPLLSTTSSRHKQARNKTRIVYTAIRNLPCPYRLLRPLPFRRHLLRLKRGLRIAAPPPLCLSKQSKHIRSRLVANMPNLRRNEASSSGHLFHFLSMRRSPFLGLSGGRFILRRHGSEFHVHGVTWCFDQNHFRKKEHAHILVTVSRSSALRSFFWASSSIQVLDLSVMHSDAIQASHQLELKNHQRY